MKKVGGGRERGERVVEWVEKGKKEGGGGREEFLESWGVKLVGGWM